jgi:hypothetical protein
VEFLHVAKEIAYSQGLISFVAALVPWPPHET